MKLKSILQLGQSASEFILVLPVILLFSLGFIALTIKTVNRWSMTYLQQEREVCHQLSSTQHNCHQQFKQKKEKLIWP